MAVTPTRTTRVELLSLLLALAAGAASVSAFAPLNWWWVILVSFAVLVNFVSRSNRPGSAFRIGFAWGLGLYLAGVSWVYVSLNVYGGMPLWMGSLAVLGFCSLLALFCAVPCWLAVRLTASEQIITRLSLLVAVWIVFEWAKSWVLTGFPWLDLGYTQTPSWFFALAPVGGVYLVSFAVVACAAALALVLQPRMPNTYRVGAILLVAVLFLFSAGLTQVHWSRADGSPLNTAIVQPNTSIETKWQSRYRDQVIARLADQTAQLASSSSSAAELVVWPETALALSYQQTDDDFWRAVVPANTAVISGLVDVRNVEESYNAAVLVCEGQRSLYRKRHLVPFGEYLPLRFLFNWVLEYLELPMSDFSAWSEQQTLSCGETLRIGLSICYEDAFANEHRVFNRGANVLVNISEDAWFGDSLAPHQRLQMAQMRARELSRPMVRSANSGPSAFIDHRGQILQRSEQFEPASLLQSIQPQTGSTPYQRFGDWIVWVCIGFAGFVAFNSRRKSISQPSL